MLPNQRSSNSGQAAKFAARKGRNTIPASDSDSERSSSAPGATQIPPPRFYGKVARKTASITVESDSSPTTTPVALPPQNQHRGTSSREWEPVRYIAAKSGHRAFVLCCSLVYLNDLTCSGSHPRQHSPSGDPSSQLPHENQGV